MRAARVNQNVIEIARTFDAPVEATFRGWTDPRLIEKWLAGQAQIDPRPGGHYRFATESLQGSPGLHVCSGEFREFVPNQRLVMTWIYNGPNPEDLGESLVTVDFVAAGPSTTEIRFREEGQGLETEDERAFSRKTWTDAFDTLEQVLTPRHQTPDVRPQ
jgi:uncharacterized protein YndB with AHSA1/START domain